jgi:YebC/PmpR family DNA-binding regulatory protein
MSGHSKWSTIKRQKGAKDAARGAMFTKLGNAIAIAARGGADPDTNFTLRLAIDKAKAANMPASNIQRSIDRVKDKGAAQLQEVTYEGYGPGGVAIIAECATDNINRTYPEVKLAFSKHGGNIAEKGAVAFQFDRKGTIRVKASGDDLLLQALDAGASDVQEDGDESIVYSEPTDLAKVRQALSGFGNYRSRTQLRAKHHHRGDRRRHGRQNHAPDGCPRRHRRRHRHPRQLRHPRRTAKCLKKYFLYASF